MGRAVFWLLILPYEARWRRIDSSVKFPPVPPAAAAAAFLARRAGVSLAAHMRG